MRKDKKMEKEVDLIINWIKEYVSSSGAKGVVVGNSGGKDSAVVIGLCQKALGKENVLSIALPCSSISGDLEDAKLVSEKFGVNLVTIDITNTYNTLLHSIENEIKKRNSRFFFYKY